MRLWKFGREGAVEVYPAGEHASLVSAGDILVRMVADEECLMRVDLQGTEGLCEDFGIRFCCAGFLGDRCRSEEPLVMTARV